VFLFPVPRRVWQDRQGDVEAFAQVDGSIVRGLVGGLSPQFQSIAVSVAFEAVKGVKLQVGGEGAAGARGRTVQRARAALLSAADALGLEAEELQDGVHTDGSANGGEVDRGPRSGDRRSRWLLVLNLALLFAAFAGLGQLAVASIEDFLVAAFELVLGRDVADSAVKTDGIVMEDIIGNEASGVVERQGDHDTDALALEGLVPAFLFAVGLRIVGGGFDVGHAGDTDELLEVLGDELGSVVGDDAWRNARVSLAGALDDGFHVRFLHFLADFPVHDEAAVAIEDRAEEVKSTGDVEVTVINMPVFVGSQGLHEAGAFLGDGGCLPGQQSGVFENAIDAGRAAGDFVGIEHHEGQPTIAFQGVGSGKGGDAHLFVVGEPVIAWHPGVVLVDLAEAQLPVVELAGADADPAKEATDGDLRLVAPEADEIDDGIAGIVGDPATG
jgi:hypothetical protein